MNVTGKLRDMLRIPDVTPEAVAVWFCLGLVGLVLLDELARWMSLP
jgi:hypothetical protein